MDRIKFVKYHGTGNDFILVEDLYGHFPIQDQEFIANLCDRHFGIGADGLILCQPSSQADFRMRYLNNDGIEATMCGNAMRCLVAYLHDGMFVDKECTIESSVGLHSAKIHDGDKVSITLARPRFCKEYPDIHEQGAYHVNTGVDHLVVFVDDVSSVDVATDGEKLRHDSRFLPHGVNVNFVTYSGGDTFSMRTFEKGVEAETLSCGTGAVAAAFVLVEMKGKPVRSVQFASEERLEFSFHKENTNHISMIWLKGSARRVFEGLIIPKKWKNLYDASHQLKVRNLTYEDWCTQRD